METNYGVHPYTDVFRRIGFCRANSDDVNFHKYLDLKLEEAEKGLVAPDVLLNDVNVNYNRYLEYAKACATQNQNIDNLQNGSEVQQDCNASDECDMQNNICAETNETKSTSDNDGNTIQNGDADNVRENVNITPNMASISYAEKKVAAPKTKKEKSDMEYKIGAGVLSVIGAVFILVAFVNFGKYFLDDIFEGLIIYAAGALVIFISELVFNRKLPIFSRVLTGLGFGVLYFATIFNCSKLKIFPVWVALILLGVTAILNIIFARIRKSQIIDIICTIGTASSVFVMGSAVSDEELLLIAGLILFVNVLMFIKRYNSAHTASTMIRLTVLFFVSMAIRMLKNTVHADEIEILAYVLIAVFVIFICYIFNTANMLIKTFSLIYMGLLLSTVVFAKSLGLETYSYVWVGGITAICIISFLAMITKKEKWTAYSVFVLSMIFTGMDCKNQIVSILVITACVILSKFLFAVKAVQLTDAFVSTLAMISAIVYHKEPLSYLILAVLLIGTLMNTRFKLYHEFMITFGFLMYSAIQFHDKFYFAPVLLLVCLVLMSLFNLIPTMKVKGITAFNICTLVIMTVIVAVYPFATAFDRLLDLFTSNDHIRMYNIISGVAIMVIGTITILGVLTKKFNLKTRAKYIILALFLTYSALSLDIDEIWRSVALMSIAFLMIAVGCVVNRFSLRIYGLILSLLVCLKVAFYDFREGTELTRMIVFLILGILAIAISVTYLLLEKYERNQMKKMQIAAQGGEKVIHTEQAHNDSMMQEEVSNEDMSYNDVAEPAEIKYSEDEIAQAECGSFSMDDIKESDGLQSENNVSDACTDSSDGEENAKCDEE